MPHQSLPTTATTTTTTYKPSPLSLGSPRTSPFKRPSSPASPFRRPDSPASPSPGPPAQTPLHSPSKFQAPSSSGSWTPRGALREPPTSPTRSSSVATAVAIDGQSRVTIGRVPPNMVGNGDAISRLPASQVREMREGFEILDRDGDGLVDREDVVDMLTNLGQDVSTTATSRFFPPGAPQTLPLPTFLSTLSSLLAPLSSQTELLNAFAAFDDHDSGEIDVGELKDALLHTAPDPGESSVSASEVDEVLGGFVARQAFGKGVRGGSRGEVFRYREWIGGLMGEEEKKDGEK